MDHYTGRDKEFPTSDSRSSHSSDDTIEPLESLELTRINTYRLQQKTTVGSTRGPLPREAWLPMGAGKEYPPLLPDPDKFVVDFEGSTDPLHPYNWTLLRRYVPPLYMKLMNM